MGKEVCYGPNNKAYGNFTFDRDCELVAVRLRHANGGFRFKDHVKILTWGYRNIQQNQNLFWTTVTNTSDSLIFPKEVDRATGHYKFDGFDVDDQLIFHNHYYPVKVLLISFIVSKITIYEYLYPPSHIFPFPGHPFL